MFKNILDKYDKIRYLLVQIGIDMLNQNIIVYEEVYDFSRTAQCY